MAGGGEIRGDLKSTLLGLGGGWLMRLWCATLRFELADRCGLGDRGRFRGPVIYALWHNRIFVVPSAWRRLCGGWRRAVVLTSASHDGAMLARAVGVFGLGAARGSSSRRGAAALVALRRGLGEGRDACFTPDGPRGPRYVLQPGVVKLAQSSGAPVVPIHVEFASAWRLRSWDRFHLPRPFSRVRVIFDRALAVPRGLGEDEFEAWRARLERILRGGVEDLDEVT